MVGVPAPRAKEDFFSAALDPFVDQQARKRSTHEQGKPHERERCEVWALLHPKEDSLHCFATHRFFFSLTLAIALLSFLPSSHCSFFVWILPPTPPLPFSVSSSLLHTGDILQRDL